MILPQALPQPTDIALLPGDSWSVRRSAQEIRATVSDLATARSAADQIEAVTRGEHWRGEAFDAFRAVVERRPLTAAVDHAAARMHDAADQLIWFADRFDDHQARLRWCRSRLTAVVASAEAERASAAAGGLPEPMGPERELAEIRREVDDVWEQHRWALRTVADTFDRLDDEPTFATPPPSTFDRARGALGGFIDGVASGTWSLSVGLAEGTRDLVVGLAEVAILLNPLTLPGRLADAWENRAQIVAVLQYAWDNPGEFFGELGRAMLDLDMLFEDPARWVGRRIPDILLTVATGGLGRIGTTAATSVRVLRGGRVADAVTGPIGLVSRQGLGGAATATDAAAKGSSLTQRLAGLGADASRLTNTAPGAFHRTDTAIGRLAGRFDQLGPGTQVMRQMPGVVNEEIKGFTSIPRRMFQDAHPSHPVSQFLDNRLVQGTIDSKLSGGITSQLGMIDGLVVGGPALSGPLQAGMVAMVGVTAFDQIAGVRDLMGDIGSAAQIEAAR